MTSEEVHQRFKRIMEDELHEDKLKAYKVFKAATEEKHHKNLDVLFDMVCAGLPIPDQLNIKIVALVHGIRTQGRWQKEFKDKYHREGEFEIFPLGYDFFDITKFLFPSYFKDEPINIIERELILLQKKFPTREISVVAHSYGTYITSNILIRGNVKICNVIFCGSIVKTNFDWACAIENISNKQILNDVGSKDYWPIAAGVISNEYGASGSFGFKSAITVDRYFRCGHSGFFDSYHYENFWAPYLMRGIVNLRKVDETVLNESGIFSLLAVRGNLILKSLFIFFALVIIFKNLF